MDVQNLHGKFYKLTDYHPYWLPGHVQNPNVDQNSRYIMDLKDSDNRNFNLAVKHYTQSCVSALNKLVEKDQELQIAIVPSHKAGMHSEGLEAIFNGIGKHRTISYQSEFLTRTKTIEKLRDGGDRDIKVHLDSIVVAQKPDPEIPVMILDDVMTSRNSLEACSKLIRDQGINVVFGVALGKTVAE